MKMLDVLALAAISILTAGPAFAADVPLPEPATTGLFAGGVAAMMWLRGRNRKK